VQLHVHTESGDTM